MVQEIASGATRLRNDGRYKTKNSSSTSGTKSSLRGTTRITFSSWNVQTFQRSNLPTSLWSR